MDGGKAPRVMAKRGDIEVFATSWWLLKNESKWEPRSEEWDERV